jgi:integrase
VRNGELLNLTWHDLDFDNGTITVGRRKLRWGPTPFDERDRAPPLSAPLRGEVCGLTITVTYISWLSGLQFAALVW